VTRTVLVIAPHPDDEVLGVGGTIASLAAAGDDVCVAIVTKGYPPAFDEEFIATGRREALDAHRLLGVRKTLFLDLPAAELDTVAHRTVNAKLIDLIASVRPNVLFVPFPGDIHMDHQLVFLSSLVAARPNGGRTVSAIYAYETLSETNWNAAYLTPGFQPNVFFDISDHLDRKLEAMQAYKSQIRPFPHERSADALRALAMIRGATIGRRAAEAFVLVRSIVD
jgi:LmbE family N-acetylglucosaminyl deacetylase